MSIDSVMPSNHLILCHPFFICLQSFSASGSFPVTQLFASGSQSIGGSAAASVLPMNIQAWFPLGLTVLIFFCSPRDSQESSPAPQFKSINSLALSLIYGPILTSIQTIGKTTALTIWTFVGKVMSLLFNMLSRLVIVFFPRSKHLLILWLQSPSAVILEPKKRKSVTASTLSPSICHEVMGPVEKAMAPYSSTLAWKIPWTEEPGGLQSKGSLRVGHDWVTSLSLFTFMHWRRKWQPTPVFLPRESHGRRSLVGCRLWGCTESDTNEAT